MLGAFQRAAGMPADRPFVRRGSGGPAILVGPGTVHVGLLLAHSGALVACEPSKLVNRYVRPLLKALSSAGAARYFGRDWISVNHRPAAWIGFAHDSRSRRAFVEAFVAVASPFATEPRRSFLGKEPGTLEGISGRPIDGARLVDRASSRRTSTRTLRSAPRLSPHLSLQPDTSDLSADPAWRATGEEAIGTIAAGPDGQGLLRLGGELLASRDAVHEAESQASSIGVDPDVMGRMVDAVFRAPGSRDRGGARAREYPRRPRSRPALEPNLQDVRERLDLLGRAAWLPRRARCRSRDRTRACTEAPS